MPVLGAVFTGGVKLNVIGAGVTLGVVVVVGGGVVDFSAGFSAGFASPGFSSLILKFAMSFVSEA
jgi:hypothetical protein